MNFKELFETGLDYRDFLETLEVEDRELMDKFFLCISKNLDENLKNKIIQINKDINILIFAEGWCPDCQINIPPIVEMKNLNKKIKMKIFKRDSNEKYIEPYKVNGKPKLPTILVLDDEYNELGHIIERPKLVKELLASSKESEALIAKRKYKKGEFLSEILKDILSIIQ